MGDLSLMDARRYFDYRDGRLIWKRRPSGEFMTTAAWKAWNTKFAGRAAGGPDPRGYWAVSMTVFGVRRAYLVHRVVWSWHHGPAPDEVDHKNNDNGNNSIENLRAATGSQNKSNRRRFQRGSCAFNGVIFRADRNSWRASIRKNGKTKNIGHFGCPTLAALAYDRQANAVFGEFAKLNFPRQQKAGVSA